MAQLRAANLYPSIDAPVFAQHGGVVANGYALTIAAANSIFYSTDGKEPSIPYTGAIPLSGEVTVKARSQSGGGEWSALTEATFLVGAVPADATNLVISEIHYRPADAIPEEVTAGFTDRDAFEFLEVMNTGALPIDLTDVRFTEGIVFTFAPLTVLLPGERLVLARDAAGFAQRYGFAPDAVYPGNLSNDGERILLLDALDAVIADMTYNDQLPWPVTADGDGFSLVRIGGNGADEGSWRPSAAVNGSPGSGDGVSYSGGSLLRLRVVLE